MDDITDDAGALVAARIRLERETRGWSLADVAERAGVAKATVSKIERGEVSPTASVLARLAAAFDLTFAGLLLRAEGAGQRLSRRVDQPEWRDPGTGYRRRQVFRRPDHPLEIAEVELSAGRSVDFPASSYTLVRQALWVRSGRLAVIEAGQRRELGPGDCLAFGPPAPTRLANETNQACFYVVVIIRS